MAQETPTSTNGINARRRTRPLLQGHQHVYVNHQAFGEGEEQVSTINTHTTHRVEQQSWPPHTPMSGPMVQRTNRSKVVLGLQAEPKKEKADWLNSLRWVTGLQRDSPMRRAE